jgi:hypothetical protein
LYVYQSPHFPREIHFSIINFHRMFHRIFLYKPSILGILHENPMKINVFSL